MNTNRQALLGTIEWSRKPSCIEDVDTTVRADHPVFAQHGPFPEVTLKEATGGDHLLGDFTRDLPLVFILKHEGARYLVDTQGYEYARYLTRITDTPTITATGLRRDLAGFADFCLDSLAEGHAEGVPTTADFLAMCADVYFRNMDHDEETETESAGAK